ncbi:MAG: hypothetical protein IJZ93_03650 [Clostridia bacterium]|nr:hypothetical protein [Clostridia bacterium]
MKIRKFLFLVMSICLILSLFSCTVEEEQPQTLDAPSRNSMVEYKISENEYLRVLYTDYYANFGEWVKDGSITKVCLFTKEKTWGWLFNTQGITKLNIEVHELAVETVTDDYGDKFSDKVGKKIAETDEGFLNSSTFTMIETGDVLQIENIEITENYEGTFDWIISN